MQIAIVNMKELLYFPNANIKSEERQRASERNACLFIKCLRLNGTWITVTMPTLYVRFLEEIVNFICFVTLCRLISYLSSIDFFCSFHLSLSPSPTFSVFEYKIDCERAHECLCVWVRTLNNAVCSCGFECLSVSNIYGCTKCTQTHTHTRSCMCID